MFVRKRNKTNEEGRWPAERRDICECVVCGGEIKGWWVRWGSLKSEPPPPPLYIYIYI